MAVPERGTGHHGGSILKGVSVQKMIITYHSEPFDLTHDKLGEESFHSPKNSALGETEQGFHWFEEVYAQRDHRFGIFMPHSEFDIIRVNPRYTAILKKINLDKRSARPYPMGQYPFNNIS